MKLTRIKAGEKFVMREGAYNAFCDAAEANAANFGAAGRSGTASGTAGPALIVQVKNNNADDTDLDAFAAVTAPNGFVIGAIPITLADNEYAVNASPMLNGQFDVSGSAAPADGVILITQEPIPFGEIGRAAIGGITVAMVDIETIGDNYAEYDGTTNKLTSGTSGRVRILAYSDIAATGDQLCLVHLQQATQKIASYTGLPAYDAVTDDGDFITMTALAVGSHTLFTGSFPVGWYEVEICASGYLSTTTSGYAEINLDRDEGGGFNAMLPATGYNRMGIANGTSYFPTPYSIRFLHYVFDETDSYRLRVTVAGSGQTFTGIATLTLTPTVRRANMTVLSPP